MEMKSRSCDRECVYLFFCHVFGVDDADEHCSPSLDYVDKFGKGWTGADLCDIAERGAFGRSRSRFVFTLTHIYFGSHICRALLCGCRRFSIPSRRMEYTKHVKGSLNHTGPDLVHYYGQPDERSESMLELAKVRQIQFLFVLDEADFGVCL